MFDIFLLMITLLHLLESLLAMFLSHVVLFSNATLVFRFLPSSSSKILRVKFEDELLL